MDSDRLLAAIVIAVVMPTSIAHGAQSTYPDKPIRLVIGSAPGSGPDIIARVLAERLYKAWGQRIVVDSRPGVAGSISAEVVHRSAADGYTWMMLTSQLFIATSIYPNLKFNLDQDFTSIALIGTVPFILTVNPQVPAKSVGELIALARKAPGKLRYGSAGTGGGEHLTGVFFTHLSGTSMLHVPYKGIPQALADTMAGELQLTFAVFPAALPHVQRDGRLRALGVSSRKPSPLLPEVPAIIDVVPGFETYGWYSLVAPTGTPNAVLAKVSAEVVKAVKEPAFGEQLKVLGIDIVGGGRAELDAFRRSERRRITELVKVSGAEVK